MRDEPLDSVARQLCTTVETVREFELFGWIYTINKNGHCMLPCQLMQKTKMLVRLRQNRQLTPHQIGEILCAQSSSRVRTIRAGDRTYSFLSFKSQFLCQDGRRVFFVRTLSGV